MDSRNQYITVSKCTLDHHYVEAEDGPHGKKDGYSLDITFVISRDLAKPFCARPQEEREEQSAVQTARAEDHAHAQYGSMMKMIKASMGERLSENEKTNLTDRSGFEDEERNRRIEAGIENSMVFSGAMEIKKRIVGYLRETYPAEPGHTSQGYPPGEGKPFEVGVMIPLKTAPREVLDLAEIFRESGMLTQNVTLEQARADAGIQAAPASCSYNDFLINLNKSALSSPARDIGGRR